jgi:hypothetical protein
LHGVSIVRLLSSIWLGVGCRIGGTCRVPLATGVGAALGLVLLDALGEQQLAKQTLSRYQNFSPSTAQARAAADAARLVGSVVTGLFARTVEEPSSFFALGDLVRTRWGMIVAPQEVVTALRQVGIELPPSLPIDRC